VIAQADNHSETVLVHEFDLDAIRTFRDAWGIYRDRRPDLYQAITTLDGGQQSV
jgi:N-carbamoylputrescine amidase